MSKTGTGLVDYCKAQLGLPYWYGTFGHVATEALYLYNKKRLPGFYTDTDFVSQYGKRVHDCVGMIKGYMWSDTPTSEPKYGSNGCPDHSADSMLAACKEQGKLSSLPDIPGVLLFMPGHVGVYIGDGQAIEAKGHRFGVVQTTVKGRGWKNWGKCPYINYETEDEDMALLKDIAAKAGVTEAEALEGLVLQAKFSNRVIEDWETEGEKFLKDSGIINTDRDPREPVEFGELGTILGRFVEYVKNHT